MDRRLILIQFIIIAGLLLDACNNSITGPAAVNVSGTYYYQTLGSQTDSQINCNFNIPTNGNITINQNGQNLTGELYTQGKVYNIKGEVSDTSSIQFTIKPEKILSPFWYGKAKNGIIKGSVEISTGGRAMPILVMKFMAIRIGI